MTHRDEVRDFLTSRRSRLSPEAARLPGGGNRRVAGLRRSEVALLAGVSVEYYSRLERGDLTGVSESVLEAIGRALQLSEAERDHLGDLARTANVSGAQRSRRRNRSDRVRPSVQYVLDAITACPAVIRNGRLDLVTGNALWYALYDVAYRGSRRTAVNLARFAFLDREVSEVFYPDWQAAADICVEVLRVEAGRDPHDRALQDLIGELSTFSDDFRRAWGRHDVRNHGSGVKHFNHDAVGDLELTYEEMTLTSDPGLILLTYSPEPASPSEDGLRLLASFAASSDRAADAVARDLAGG